MTFDPAALRDVPLEARIRSAPADIAALALRRNLAHGVAIEPRPAPLDHPVAGALRRMLASLPLSVAPVVYRALGETDLPSLYGSIDPYEDFAETFAIYVHTRLLHPPFRVDLYLGPERIGEYRSCLDTGRCPAKLAFMARLLSADRAR